MLFKKIIPIALLLIFTLAILTGCDSDPTEVDDYSPEAVLYGFMVTDSIYGDIKLQRVAKNITEYYDPADHVISDAFVTVFPVMDVANDSTIIADPSGYMGIYEESATNPGTYICQNNQVVNSGWMYRVEVRFDDENQVEPDMWAETTAPSSADFIVTTNYPEVDALMDVYPDDINNIPLSFSRNDSIIRTEWTNAWPWSPNDYHTNPPGGLYLSILALSDTTDMIPLDPDWDPDDPDDELEPSDYDPHGWTVVPNYQEALPVVWLYFEWSGPQRIDACAVSIEYYRYLFTCGEFEGGPSSVVRPESNIHGGLGVFGALVQRSFFINMIRQEY